MIRLALYLLALLILGATPPPIDEAQLARAVYAHLSTLQRQETDKLEASDVREARLRQVSRSVAAMAITRPSGWEPVRVAGFLTALGTHESHFASYVGAGCLVIPKGAADCDKRRARSYWQMWALGPCATAAWALPVGSEESERAFAKCAAERWLGQYYSCPRLYGRSKDAGSPVAMAFNGYRSHCIADIGEARERTYGRHVARIRKELSR